MENCIINLKDIVVEYDGERVLNGLNLEIHDKEFVTFLGPSGCGKTTTLRIIGGFVEPKEGDIFFDGVRINDLPPHKRQLNTVFQRYALFPHLNVYENVEFGLKLRKMPESERKQRVREMLELVNLKGFERRNINQLSGGQQQRVAIARALAIRPVLILADEPTGNLDYKTGQEVLGLLRLSQRELGRTVVMVTHDRESAALCDRVVTIEDGRIVC